MNFFFIFLSLKFFKKWVNYFFIINEELYLLIKPVFLYDFVNFLKNSTFFNLDSVLDIFGLDFLNGSFNNINNSRLKVMYNFISYKFNYRVNISVFFEKDNFFIKSLSNLFESSNWLEREVWDMFGIFFYDHSDLRRILTDYGFEGFPMRKDFPLNGFFDVRYDSDKKKIFNSFVEVSQEYRSFISNKPWKSY